MTRERMYLETMERVLGGADKTIIDQPAAAAGRRALSAAHRTAAAAATTPAQPPRIGGRQPMKPGLAGGVIAILLVVAAVIVGYSTLFTVYQTQQALVVRLGQPVRVITEPGLNVKVPFIETRHLYRQAHSRHRNRRRRK